MKRKPSGGMIVIAVLDFIFGFLGLVLAVLGIASSMAAARKAIVIEGSMGIPGATVASQAAATHLLGMSLLSLLIALAAVAGGLALFLMWRWARALNLAYAWLAILRGLILFFSPALVMAASGPAPSMAQRFLGLLFGILYPVIVLLLFARPSWKSVAVRVPESPNR